MRETPAEILDGERDPQLDQIEAKLVAMAKTLEYKPSAFYFRQALRAASTKKQAVVVGLQAIRELENLKAYIRGLGLEPPRRYILSNEAEDKRLCIESLD